MDDREYFLAQGLNSLIADKSLLDQGISGDKMLPPQLADLCRLHRTVRQRKVFQVLEFGVGYSTLVIAHALKLNREDFKSLKVRPELKSEKFKLYTLDTSEKWLQKTKERLPEYFGDLVELHHSGAHVGTYNGQICHYFDKIPVCTPDFIYLDGPSPLDVRGVVNGLQFQTNQLTVMSADLLLIEPILEPGAVIHVDGRGNNARFLKNNFKRNFKYNYNSQLDFHEFELNEGPIGKYNRIKMEYCLGKILG